jgi:hypothetical protein
MLDSDHEPLPAPHGIKPGHEGVTALPPRQDWIFSGTMTKKVISAAGIKWQPRFSVLTGDYLAFTRPFDRSNNFLPDLTLTSDTLRKAFDEFDVDKNGEEILKHLSLVNQARGHRGRVINVMRICLIPWQGSSIRQSSKWHCSP